MTVDVAIIGLGYVGLPLAAEATRAGLTVLGYDVNASVVEALNDGRSHIDDLTDADIAKMRSAGFRATTDEAEIGTAEAALICVPTPLSADGGPDLGAVTSAVASVTRQLHPGMLVVLESTTYPGTTDEVVRPDARGIGSQSRRRTSTSPSLRNASTPATSSSVPGTRPRSSGGYTEQCTDRAAELLRTVRRHGRSGARCPRGRDREAAGEHLPAHQHRLGERDGPVLPRAGHRSVGCHPGRLEQAVRLPGVLPRSRRRRPLHPDRPQLPQPQRAGQARLPIPVRRAGRRRSTPPCPAYVAQRAQNMLNGAGKAIRDASVLLLGVDVQAEHRRSARVACGAACPAPGRPRRAGSLPRPVRRRVECARSRTSLASTTSRPPSPRPTW